MPELPALPPEKLARALEKKGFVLDRIRGSHYAYCHPDLDVTVTVPFYKKEIGKGLLIEIMKGRHNPELLDLLLKGRSFNALEAYFNILHEVEPDFS